MLRLRSLSTTFAFTAGSFHCSKDARRQCNDERSERERRDRRRRASTGRLRRCRASTGCLRRRRRASTGRRRRRRQQSQNSFDIAVACPRLPHVLDLVVVANRDNRLADVSASHPDSFLGCRSPGYG